MYAATNFSETGGNRRGRTVRGKTYETETLPKSCIFFEVALAQVLGRDKPVLQMHLIIKTRFTDSSTLE